MELSFIWEIDLEEELREEFEHRIQRDTDRERVSPCHGGPATVTFRPRENLHNGLSVDLRCSCGARLLFSNEILP